MNFSFFYQKQKEREEEEEDEEEEEEEEDSKEGTIGYTCRHMDSRYGIARKG